jgi:hypothetical protein
MEIAPREETKVVQRKKMEEKHCNNNTTNRLGIDSGDESIITIVGLTGKIGDGYDSRSKLFHIRVIMKHTKINTLIDSGSQYNLISEEVVKKLGLTTKMHHKPYSLNWISKDHKLSITKQCIIQFEITSKYVDEVLCDVVSLESCGMVRGIPYLYDHKAIFYKEHNQYHLFKKGNEYVVHVHHIKENQSLLTMEQLKKASYESNKPIIVPSKEVDLKHEHEMVIGWEFNHTLLQDKLMSCNHIKHIGSLSIIFLMLLLLIFSTWMVLDSVRCE